MIRSALPFALLATTLAAGQQQAIVRVEAEEIVAAPGRKSEARIAVTVATGYHVQANPAANEFLIPLTVVLEHGEEIDLGEPRYPPPKKYRLEGSDEDLLVYGGTFTVEVPIEVGESASRQQLELEGRLRYQACDSRFCYAPATLPFTVTVKVLGRGLRSESTRGEAALALKETR